jgi:hypothetical protein
MKASRKLCSVSTLLRQSFRPLDGAYQRPENLLFSLHFPNLRTESFPCLRRIRFEVLYCALGMRETDRQLLVAGLWEETKRVARVALRGPSRKRAHWMWEGSRGLHKILEHDYWLV